MKSRLPIEEYKALCTYNADVDAELQTFLEQLDQSDLMLTDWEAGFVSNYLQARSEGRGNHWFTPGRRERAIQMREKYHVQLQLPGRVKFHATRKALSDLAAAPGGCMYLVNEPGHPQRPCNDPATCQTRNAGPARTGFRYCELHREIAAEACRRKQVPFSTQPIQRPSSAAR